MQNQPNFPLSSFRFTSYTQIGKDEQKKLAQIVNSLIDAPEAIDFLHPVAWKQLQLDDYPDIIKHPMNLYKVQQKMKAREYNTVEQVLDHIQLIWDNCKDYNKEGHYFQLAQKMEKMLKKMIKNYIPSVQYTYQPKITTSTPQFQQMRKYNMQGAMQPPARTFGQKAPQKQFQQKPQPVHYQRSQSKSQKQVSQDEPEIEQVPLSQKNRFHQRLKLITQQQLAQIVAIIQQFCSQGFKHISGGRYQILVDHIDGETFKKLSQKVDDFIENQKVNGLGLGNKKVKV